MSIEEVERVLLYTLEASVSTEERKRLEAQELVGELSEKVENAAALFQLLLKYELKEEAVSLRIIKILQSHLIKIDGEIASQLRGAFISDFFQSIVLNSQQSKSIKSFIKGAICQFLLTAFLKERLTGTWPNSISSLLTITKGSQVGREIFMKFCLMLTEEISNSQGGNPYCNRNADLRDSMRLGDNALLCGYWRQILQDYANSGTGEVVDVVLGLECLASFAGWIDVSLVVEGETLKLIYFYLQSSQPQIQSVAADCLAEIIAKGMSATDKIALANYMNLSSVFEAVGQRGVIDGFFCKSCKILNNLVVSLNLQINLAVGIANQASIQDQVIEYTCPVLFPHLLRFLQILSTAPLDDRGDDQWDEAMETLLPCISSTFEVARSVRDQLRSDQVDFMGRFLPLCFNLMKLPESEVLNYEQQGDVNEIRTTLMQAFDSVLWLQGHATLAMLNSISTDQSRLTLSRGELLSRLILRVPEAMRGQPTFSISINGEARMTPISELVTWAITSVPGRYPQLIPLICDILVRYSSTTYLDSFPNRIDEGLKLLSRLLELRRFKEADCEKLLKFVKNLKGKLGAYSGVLLGTLQEQSRNRLLSSSLYEIYGLAVASLDSRTIPTEGLISSLLQGALEASMQADDSPLAIPGLECLGCFAKGFMTDSSLDPSIVQSWYREYCNGYLVNRVKEQVSEKYLNSSISFSQRIIPLIQAESIPLLKELSIAVITFDNNTAQHGELSSSELMSQLLPLLSASLFKLRDQFSSAQVIGHIWSLLLPKLHDLLNEPIQGTDDLIQYMNLCKSWLSFLQALTATPNAANSTLALKNPLFEATILKIIEKSTLTTNSNTDNIGLLRSLCGVINRCQAHMSRDFINSTVVPLFLHRSIPEIFHSLDPSSKKSPSSLPAALLNFLQDFLQMIRSLIQNANLNGSEWSCFNGVDLVGREVKECRTDLVNYFLSVTRHV